jgi:hypothetical protein
MVDLTSGAYGFRQAVETGDLYTALGLAEGARKLDVDVAAARLAERAPWLARQVTAVANVLTHPDRRSVYQTLRDLRDRIVRRLVQRHGAELLEAIPDFRRELWKSGCALVHFHLEDSELDVGPRGVASLADRAEDWLADQLVAAHLTVMVTTVAEDTARAAVREVWTADCRQCGHTLLVPCQRIAGDAPSADGRPAARRRPSFTREHYNYVVPPCPHCQAEDNEPADYDDTFTFTIPVKPSHGAVLRGQGRQTGKTIFTLRDGKPLPSLPTSTLTRFYELQQQGTDVTLEEAESEQRKAARRAATPVRTRTSSRESTFGQWGLALLILFIVGSVVGVLRQTPSQRQSGGYRGGSPPWTPPRFELPKIEPFKFDPSLQELLNKNVKRDSQELYRQLLRTQEQLGPRKLPQRPREAPPDGPISSGTEGSPLPTLKEASQRTEAVRNRTREPTPADE